MSDETHPLVEDDRLMLVPGVYDALSAKLAARAGFDVAVLTGYGFAASQLGEPDVGLFTANEILDAARRITAAADLGLIVDGDTGHGGPLNVQKTVRDLVRAGALGIILEDQKWPKRCGHMRGKEVIPAEEHVQKIRAARDAAGDRLTITARTDALETDGMEEALRRARLYKEAGADVLFVEGPRTREELETIGEALPGPLSVNLIEGGRTPNLTLEELEAMGFYSVGYVLSGLYAAASALETTYETLRREGSTEGLEDVRYDFEAFNSMIGREKRFREAERYRAD